MQVLSCRCIYKYLRSRVCGDIKPPRYLGRGLRPRPIKTAARRRRQSHAAMGPAYQPVLLLLSLWLHCTVTRHTPHSNLDHLEYYYTARCSPSTSTITI